MTRLMTTAAAFALLAGGAWAADPLTLQLKWVTQAQFAGYYVAEAKGFYDEEGLKSQKEREERAKEKLYSLLPDDQKRELVSLFDEFESYESPEARFAHAMDNVQPLILNDSNEGGDWKDHQVSAELVYGRHKKTKLGSEKLYEVSDEILQKNIKKGNLKE